MKTYIALLLCAVLASLLGAGEGRKGSKGGFRGSKVDCDDMNGSCETFAYGGPPLCSSGTPRARCRPEGGATEEGYSLCCATDDNVEQFCSDQGGECKDGSYDNSLGYPEVMQAWRRAAREACGEGNRPFRPMLFCSFDRSGSFSICCVPQPSQPSK